MSDIDNDLSAAELPDELTTLKGRADLLGIAYHPSIGVEKLREKVKAALAGSPTKDEADAAPQAVKAKSEADIIREHQLSANELIRVRVACMNPAMKDWEGDIFTVGNSVVGTIKKYVPFNTDEGWHIPRMLYDDLVSRECQVFVSTKDDKGNTIRRGKLIRAYAVEVLPALTKEELHDLAQRQAMANSIG